jgi:hypothetical protein
MPLESLHGRKDDVGRTLRLAVQGVLSPDRMGEFSLEANQGDVRAVFVPLAVLQAALEVGNRVNAILVSGGGSPESRTALERIIRDEARPEDLGLFLQPIDGAHAVRIGSDTGLLDDRAAAAVRQAIERVGGRAQPIFTYLANTIRANGREIPYSLVAALDVNVVAPELASRPATGARAPIVLNEWAARELAARTGDPATIEYYVWEEPGRLISRSADLEVAAVVPIEAGDPELAPSYPGISDSPTLTDWDPPFPVDLRRIRPVDEQYWEQHRTTPKAFVPLEVGQRLWRTRYGQLTSMRAVFAPGPSLSDRQQQLTQALHAVLDPIAFGLAPRAVRADALAASRGATDFGAYFVYFSFFLVVSALLLAALFFRLGLEQRVREIGLLRAVGLAPSTVRRLYLAEGAGLAAAGSVLGVLGAVGYASLLMIALQTRWLDAVGTTALRLHVTAASLAGGSLGGVAAAIACIWWTLRRLGRVSERQLIAGEVADDDRAASGGRPYGRMTAAGALAVVGLGSLGAAALGLVGGAGAFFGAAAALLGAALCLFSAAVRWPFRPALGGHGWPALARLGMRSTTSRPGRAVLSVAVIASATFILLAVDAFRRDGTGALDDPHAGTGGYPLMIESLLPVARDPNTPEGREALNLTSLDPSISFEPFRLRPGDDASCLNLYEPRNPRILAARDRFLTAGRFAFQSSLSTTEAERANPWLLLKRAMPDGAVPVIADANSMTYVLHRRLGEDIVLEHGGAEIRLRLVAALRDSIFQRELLMSEASFLERFPEIEGYRVMLVDAPADRAAELGPTLEQALADLGGDAVATGPFLAGFHRVENTYLSTFQMLGGLGLLLGTFGLAAVLLRNVLERRRELALLRSVGFQRRHLVVMVLAENALLLLSGLLAGALCAALAVAPSVAERGGRVPWTSGGGWLPLAVLAAGLLGSLLAVGATTRSPLLESLRSE